MPKPRTDAPLEPRQQHLLMQLVALGDQPGHAAFQLGVMPDAVQEVWHDPDFQQAKDAEAALIAMAAEAWDRRLDGQIRQATGRALLESKPGTLNLLLRLRRASPAGRGGGRTRDVVGDEQAEATEDDEEAWLDSLPVVEADPEREVQRRQALRQAEPKAVRRTIGHAPLRGIEQYLVAGDPVAYEEWFARQPKPPRQPANLSEADRAAVAHVTRNNPPWIRGEYLGYFRPPVPAHLFEPAAQSPALLPAPVETPPTIATPLADLRARIARLLDRSQPRLFEELDLAEAICAVKWPKWPDYHGRTDLGLLRRALSGFALADGTVNWLGSRELAAACRAAKPP